MKYLKNVDQLAFPDELPAFPATGLLNGTIEWVDWIGPGLRQFCHRHMNESHGRKVEVHFSVYISTLNKPVLPLDLRPLVHKHDPAFMWYQMEQQRNGQDGPLLTTPSRYVNVSRIPDPADPEGAILLSWVDTVLGELRWRMDIMSSEQRTFIGTGARVLT